MVAMYMLPGTAANSQLSYCQITNTAQIKNIHGDFWRFKQSLVCMIPTFQQFVNCSTRKHTSTYTPFVQWQPVIKRFGLRKLNKLWRGALRSQEYNLISTPHHQYRISSTGKPQGTVLSQFLFTLYTSDFQ